MLLVLGIELNNSIFRQAQDMPSLKAPVPYLVKQQAPPKAVPPLQFFKRTTRLFLERSPQVQGALSEKARVPTRPAAYDSIEQFRVFREYLHEEISIMPAAPDQIARIREP